MAASRENLVTRLRRVLPDRWFPDEAPVLDAVLSGLAAAWSRLHDLLDAVRLQARLRTVSGGWLDMAGGDFFGSRLPRRGGETDAAYRGRLLRALRRSHATRNALAAALTELTGTEPDIFEPALTTDTGGYSTPGLAWGAAGGWGALMLPYQCFVTVLWPGSGPGSGSGAGGYGAGGAPAYGTGEAAVPPTDAEILAAVAEALPAGSLAWTRITPR